MHGHMHVRTNVCPCKICTHVCMYVQILHYLPGGWTEWLQRGSFASWRGRSYLHSLPAQQWPAACTPTGNSGCGLCKSEGNIGVGGGGGGVGGNRWWKRKREVGVKHSICLPWLSAYLHAIHNYNRCTYVVSQSTYCTYIHTCIGTHT